MLHVVGFVGVVGVAMQAGFGGMGGLSLCVCVLSGVYVWQAVFAWSVVAGLLGRDLLWDSGLRVDLGVVPVCSVVWMLCSVWVVVVMFVWVVEDVCVSVVVGRVWWFGSRRDWGCPWLQRASDSCSRSWSRRRWMASRSSWCSDLGCGCGVCPLSFGACLQVLRSLVRGDRRDVVPSRGWTYGGGLVGWVSCFCVWRACRYVIGGFG